MGRILIFLLVFIPSTCFAFPPGFFGAISGPPISCVTATSINGISAISEGGPTTTGTCDYALMGTGTITITAACVADATHYTYVALVVDEVERDRLECADVESIPVDLLTYAVSAGTHSISVTGAIDGSSSFNTFAATFSIPVP